MNINEVLDYIHSVCWKGMMPGLSRVTELLEKMGNPEKDLKFIHIAGTNGKGSTAAMSASILRKAGYCTGLYTSPYIYQFGERMQVNGELIPDEELIEITLNNDVLKVDGNNAIAWSGSLSFTVERSGKSLIGSAASGEGLVNVYRGTGKVLLAPVVKGLGI